MHRSDRMVSARAGRPWLGQVAERLERTQSFADAMDVLLEAIRTIGFSGVDYGYLPATRLCGAWVAPPVETRAFPAGWDRHWHRYSADDPYYHACLEDRPWIEWRDIQARDGLTARERDAIAYLQGFGIACGVTIPIRLQGGRLAFVTALGEPARAPEVAADRLLALAHYFHHHLQHRRMLRDWHPAALLTPREAECLSWAARGKTAEDSALILGRSAETVRVHLKHAIAKLRARNVTHAVAKAILLELIEA